MSQYLS
jgi:hypothetical protein